MPLPISPITVPARIEAISPAIQMPGENRMAGEFRGVLEGAINSVEKTGAQAQQAVSNFLSGSGEELHAAILATQRADLAFELGLQVRNKVVAAYQEVMRLQM